MSGVPSYLLGVGVDAMCGVLLFRLPCGCPSPCWSVRVMSDEMRLWAAAECYQVLALLACRIVSPRSSTRGTGREAERTRAGGADMLGGWSVREVCLVLSRAGCSDEMMRNDGGEGG